MEKHRRYILPFFVIFPFVFCSLLGPRLIIPWPSDSIIPHFSLKPSEPDPSLHLTRDPREKLQALTSFTCDRSSKNTDVCFLQGDIRTSPLSYSIFLYAENYSSPKAEKIRPYTRKGDANLMPFIKEVELAILNGSAGGARRCDAVHGVPAVVFAAGGFTGNVYHDFNDVMIPLYITSKRFDREVVFVILEYHPWWVSKYKDIFSQLSAYPPVDFFAGNLTHCFSEIIVGLHFHDDLTIDPSANITILNFHRLLDNAYRPRIESLPPLELPEKIKPKLVMIFRDGSRAVENETALVMMAEEIGFRVETLRPEITMEMAIIYRALNSSDAMVGVIGCALTHFLFQKPGDVFIQIVGLGTDWAAEKSYGSPAKKMGLKYIPYKINPWESSLSRIYDKEDPVIKDPDSVAEMSWDVRKRIYLDQQNVSLDLNRFGQYLTRAYEYLDARKNSSR